VRLAILGSERLEQPAVAQAQFHDCRLAAIRAGEAVHLRQRRGGGPQRAAFRVDRHPEHAVRQILREHASAGGVEDPPGSDAAEERAAGRGVEGNPFVELAEELERERSGRLSHRLPVLLKRSGGVPERRGLADRGERRLLLRVEGEAESRGSFKRRHGLVGMAVHRLGDGELIEQPAVLRPQRGRGGDVAQERRGVAGAPGFHRRGLVPARLRDVIRRAHERSHE
jgi:hypothetical protein